MVNLEYNNEDPTKRKKCECEFDECILVLGGDWMWIATNFGYTGPKLLHFCKDCLCQLSDLQKGTTHTPFLLSKYEQFMHDTHKFEMRTFEKLQADYSRYKQSGDPRSKIKEYNNCEFESLFRGTGPIILKTSCMPLRISLGFGLKVLNTIEENAIAIDNEIKSENGQQTNEINQIMDNLKVMSSEPLDKKEKVSQINEETELKKITLQNLEQHNASALKKTDNGKSYCDKTTAAKKIQQQHKEKTKEIKSIEKGKKVFEKDLQATEENLEILNKQLSEKR